MLRALIWDVDGTLAETERDAHCPAFNDAFEEAGLPWRWDEAHYGELLRITGGHERLLHDMNQRPDAPRSAGEREALVRRLHAAKTRFYAARVAQGHIELRPGVRALLVEAVRAHVPLAIATTTSRANLDALMRVHLGDEWHSRFAVVACAEDAPMKKPDPQVYHLVLARLGLGAAEVLALEDAPAGVEACRRAGVPVLVTRSSYFPDTAADDPPSVVVAAGPGLETAQGWSRPLGPGATRISLDVLRDWHRWHAEEMRSGAASAAGRPPVA